MGLFDCCCKPKQAGGAKRLSVAAKRNSVGAAGGDKRAKRHSVGAGDAKKKKKKAAEEEWLEEEKWEPLSQHGFQATCAIHFRAKDVFRELCDKESMLGVDDQATNVTLRPAEIYPVPGVELNGFTPGLVRKATMKTKFLGSAVHEVDVVEVSPPDARTHAHTPHAHRTHTARIVRTAHPHAARTPHAHAHATRLRANPAPRSPSLLSRARLACATVRVPHAVRAPCARPIRDDARVAKRAPLRVACSERALHQEAAAQDTRGEDAPVRTARQEARANL